MTTKIKNKIQVSVIITIDGLDFLRKSIKKEIKHRASRSSIIEHLLEKAKQDPKLLN